MNINQAYLKLIKSLTPKIDKLTNKENIQNSTRIDIIQKERPLPYRKNKAIPTSGEDIANSWQHKTNNVLVLWYDLTHTK